MKSKLLVFICLLIVIVPGLVFGAEPVIVPTTQAPFIPLVGIPGIPNPSTLQFGDYINSLYRLAISIAALLAVFKIVIAGAKYMLDDVVTHKQEAKDEIRGALVGLLIILGAVLILNTVNTDITKNMIAIDVLDTSSSSTIAALLAEIEKANAEARNACILAGPNCVTITCGIFDGWMEPQNNETDIDACNRTCQDVFKGKFVGHQIGDVTIGGYTPSIETGWQTATCSYDKTVAASCDINGSKACCEYINTGTWYSGHNMCQSANLGFTELQCGDGGLLKNTPEADCATAKKTCTDAGSTVLSVTPPDPNATGWRRFYGSLLCSVPSTINNDTAARAAYIATKTAGLTFTTPTLDADFDTNLGETLGTMWETAPITADDIDSMTSIPLTDLLEVTEDDTIYTEMAAALSTKCASGNVQYFQLAAAGKEEAVQFYCLK